MKFADFAAQRVDVSGKTLINDKGFFKAPEGAQTDLGVLLRMQSDAKAILATAQEAVGNINELLDQFEVEASDEWKPNF